MSGFSPNLFWDIDKKQLDMDACPGQIIQRVLEYGEFKDWRIILSYYGLDKIVSEVKKLRTLDLKALSFLCCISNTQKEEYRCYQYQQSNRIHWTY